MTRHGVGNGVQGLTLTRYTSVLSLFSPSEFANCSTGRTVSVAWACRAQHRAVQACMKPYTSDEAMGERRRAYLREKRARNRAAAAVAAAADADVAAAAQDPIVRRDVVYEPLPMVAASNGQAEARAGAGTATLRPQQQQQQSPPPVASLFSSGKAQAQQPQQRLV